jgi:hypothetical protein
MDKNNKIWTLLVFGLVALATVGGGAYMTWQSLQQKTTEDTSPMRQESRGIVSITSGETVLKENSDNRTQTDVYILDPDNGTEEFFMTLEDVYAGHYHVTEYVNSSLYVIRRIGYDSSDDDEWSDELWKYDSQGQGTQLYSSRGIDFRVAPSGSTIAVKPGSLSDSGLIIVDSGSNVLHSYTINELAAAQMPESIPYIIELQGWSDDSTTFWCSLNGQMPVVVISINASTYEMTRYDVEELDIGSYGEYVLNTNEGLLAYSNYPMLFDTEGLETYRQSGAEVYLVVYNFKTGAKQQIATSITKAFRPTWIADDTIEYNDSQSDQRVQEEIQ